MPVIKIKERIIGPGYPCYIIAEMSANHGGSLERAMKIVRAAAEAGADAIKLQTYTADTMTLDVENNYFRIEGGTLWDGKRLYDLYRQAATPWEWHGVLKEEAKKEGLDFFSTPFDETAVDFLESLEVPAYKIASFELTDDPLLRKVASTHKPVILSTGMASEEEVRHALDMLRGAGASQIALLKCVSAYPAPVDQMNLLALKTLQERFALVVGLSDHSLGSLSCVIGVALGARIIEKHLWLGDGQQTLDSQFSLDPAHFKQMVSEVREASLSLGHGRIEIGLSERNSLRFRRSIFAVRDIGQGEVFSRENIRVIRPGFGLAPSLFDKILGMRSTVAIKKGIPLERSMVDGLGASNV